MSSDMHKHFTTRDVDWNTLDSIICQSAWSPIVWKTGVRDSQNFLSASLIALDFDSGLWTIDDAVSFAEDLGLRYIIGTTKSHQTPKKGLTCDRFRLILDFAQTVKILDYTWTMKQLGETINAEQRSNRYARICDMSCMNASRFFYPCKEIVASGTGKKMPAIISKWAEYHAELQQENAERMRKRALINGDFNLLPAWVKELLYKGNFIGRSDSLWRASRFMHDAGFTSDEIYTHLHRINSPLLTLEDERTGKVMEVIENGDKYGKNYYF